MWEKIAVIGFLLYFFVLRRKDGEVVENMPRIIIGTQDYYIGEPAVNWAMAKDACVQLNKKLLSLETDQEFIDLTNSLKQNYLGRIFWTSGNDLMREKEFYWDTVGKPVTLDNRWKPGQPNDWTKEDCLVLDGGYEFYLNDVACAANYSYICEGPAGN